jgi:glyoxylase-like metal-dependent hydrolase (beta-lactamase superfamily II)
MPTGIANERPFHRLRVGAVDVTAISDGYLPVDPKLLPKSTSEEVAPLLEAAGLPQGPLRASINAFIIDTPGRRVLIDAGLGPGLADTAGRFRDNLAAAGVTPESVDVILLTHLHRDHVRGISDHNGEAVFPNARVVLHEAELSFWTDEAEESRAPAFAKQYFPIARAALQPYAARTSTFFEAGDVLGAIEAVPAPGHPPGHTMYRVVSGGSSLLIAADIVHMPVLQFPRPDWSIALDVDGELAAKTRCRVLDAAVVDRELVTGMHFTSSGFGRFRRAGRGYLFEAEAGIGPA